MDRRMNEQRGKLTLVAVAEDCRLLWRFPSSLTFSVAVVAVESPENIKKNTKAIITPKTIAPSALHLFITITVTGLAILKGRGRMPRARDFALALLYT